MRIIKSINSLKSEIIKLKRQNRSIGFVPTMGALHQGHLSLIKRSRRENDITIISIYVNPTQFDPKKADFSSYPRDKKSDILLANNENVDIIFLPTNKSMYPAEFSTEIITAGLTENLCGKYRPGHFNGVTTIVGKLLNIVSPDSMYLGQKDAQQAIVLKQMVIDLNFDVAIKICPTVREKDGLALSSRNLLLSRKDREEARILYQSLREAKNLIKKGQRDSVEITRMIKMRISSNTRAKIEYVECVNYETLNKIDSLNGLVLIALAVRFKTARLIDNIRVTVR